MANDYLGFSESITELTEKEKDWANKFLTAGCPEVDEDVQGHEQWCNARGVLPGDDYDIDSYPAFSWSIGNEGELWLYSEESFNRDHLITFVQLFLQKFRSTSVFTITYAGWCSAPCVGAFGGGWVAVSAFDVIHGTTYNAVGEASRLLQARVELVIQAEVEASKG